MKLPPIIIATGLILSAVCASLGWIAITDHHLTTSGKLGITTYDGVSAVVAGWFWFAVSFYFVGMLAVGFAFRKLIWLGLAILYIASLTIYWQFFYDHLK